MNEMFWKFVLILTTIALTIEILDGIIRLVFDTPWDSTKLWVLLIASWYAKDKYDSELIASWYAKDKYDSER